MELWLQETDRPPPARAKVEQPENSTSSVEAALFIVDAVTPAT
jgi:hypothetical protein